MNVVDVTVKEDH